MIDIGKKEVAQNPGLLTGSIFHGGLNTTQRNALGDRHGQMGWGNLGMTGGGTVSAAGTNAASRASGSKSSGRASRGSSSGGGSSGGSSSGGSSGGSSKGSGGGKGGGGSGKGGGSSGSGSSGGGGTKSGSSKGKGGGKGSSRRGYGGIISEPIVGIGMQTGNEWLIGEHGNERISPIDDDSGVGLGNIIINVGNITKEADYMKLKPLIQRWILEASSRRGTV